jgi:hypothetical protein
MSMTIIGAGMAGLVAGHYFSKGPTGSPAILEAQPSLPNNHQALLRFRSANVGDVTGIPFKKALVRKSIVNSGQYHSECNPYLANMYSRKVTDEVNGRSIWNMSPAERYIAPGNFISLAAKGLNIWYDYKIEDFNVLAGMAKDDPVISTMPMPTLMHMSGWPRIPEFKWRPIWSFQAELTEAVDVYQTLYYPQFDVPYYRASITGRRIIIEFLDDPDDPNKSFSEVAKDFGIWPSGYCGQSIKRQEYGKLVTSDDNVCKDFMYTMTRDYNIYSLGRFATWRQILMDDVVDDCKVIGRMIGAETSRSKYHQALEHGKL